MKRIFTVIFAVLMISTLVYSQNKVEKGGKVWGYVFGDYFFKASGDSSGGNLQYSPYTNSSQGFEIRRMYLGYDYVFNEKF